MIFFNDLSQINIIKQLEDSQKQLFHTLVTDKLSQLSFNTYSTNLSLIEQCFPFSD